jgi:hypothetical protein
MTQAQKYLILGFTVLIITVVGMIALRSHTTLFSTPNYKPYQDSIARYKLDIKKIQFKEDSLAKVDSALVVVKNQLTKQYYEKLKHITILNNQQLDSLIKSELRHK